MILQSCEKILKTIQANLSDKSDILVYYWGLKQYVIYINETNTILWMFPGTTVNEVIDVQSLM